MGSVQESVPLQLMSQLDARAQSIALVQEFWPHSTRHGTPGGHATSAVQEPGVLQSKTQTPPTQFVHTSSHARVLASGPPPFIAPSFVAASMIGLSPLSSEPRAASMVPLSTTAGDEPSKVHPATKSAQAMSRANIPLS
jgi:hypothetical protein